MIGWLKTWWETRQSVVKKQQEEIADLVRHVDEAESELYAYTLIPQSWAYDWTPADSEEWSGCLATKSGRKFRMYMENIERFYTHQSIRQPDPAKREQAARIALGVSEMMRAMLFMSKVREPIDPDGVESKSRKFSRDDLNDSQIENRINEMARGRRLHPTHVMG